MNVTVQVDPALQSGVGFEETAVAGTTRPLTEVTRVVRSNKTPNLAMPRMWRSLRGEFDQEDVLFSYAVQYASPH